MVDALLVFSPLQEICFFVLRSPYLDQIGVAPLLRRRLFGLQSFSLCWLLQVRLLASSPTFVFVAFALRHLLHFTHEPFAFCLAAFAGSRLRFFRCVAPYLPLSVWPLRVLIRKDLCKTFSAVTYSVLLSFLQRTRRLLSNYATPLEVFMLLS